MARVHQLPLQLKSTAAGKRKVEAEDACPNKRDLLLLLARVHQLPLQLKSAAAGKRKAEQNTRKPLRRPVRTNFT